MASSSSSIAPSLSPEYASALSALGVSVDVINFLQQAIPGVEVDRMILKYSGPTVAKTLNHIFTKGKSMDRETFQKYLGALIQRGLKSNKPSVMKGLSDEGRALLSAAILAFEVVSTAEYSSTGRGVTLAHIGRSFPGLRFLAYQNDKNDWGVRYTSEDAPLAAFMFAGSFACLSVAAQDTYYNTFIFVSFVVSANLAWRKNDPSAHKSITLERVRTQLDQSKGDKLGRLAPTLPVFTYDGAVAKIKEYISYNPKFSPMAAAASDVWI